jgi:hypothetical protein
VAALLVLALLGLGITLFGRRLVARVAFVTTAPWWLAGVALGIDLAWSGEPAERWSAAVLVAVAAAGLLAARLRQPVAPFLGSPLLVPAVSGLVIGTAVAGALSLPGPVALPLAGYAGILLVSVADAYLSGWARGLLRPVTLTAGVTVSVLAVGQLLAAERWTALGLLCLLAALPLVLVAVRRPEERPETTPAAIGCLAAAVLFALAAGRSSGSGAAVVLTGLYAASLATAALLQPSSRRPTLAVGAACATAAVVLLVALGARSQLAGQLAIQGGLTCAWAWWALSPAPPAGSGTGPAPGRTAWRLGAAQLVLAAWTTAGVLELRVLEAYTLPAAVGLLVAAGPRLTLGPSWPTWGPGLLLAAVPSTAAAVLAPGALRPVLVIVAAAAVMSAGARWGVRAPLLVGAGTAVAVGLGLAALELPLPALGAMAVGLALLLLGASRERRPVAGFGVRLADLR